MKFKHDSRHYYLGQWFWSTLLEFLSLMHSQIGENLFSNVCVSYFSVFCAEIEHVFAHMEAA